jgi:hypothetical protein
MQYSGLSELERLGVICQLSMAIGKIQTDVFVAGEILGANLGNSENA